MSGRGIKSDEVMPASRPYGLHTRLHSHFSGRRSGDQFCVYVADLLVLPGLTPADIEDVSAGRHTAGRSCSEIYSCKSGLSVWILPDGKIAREVETSLKNGAWARA
jgi:hypothetical protein